jgi:hypothetical protein
MRSTSNAARMSQLSPGELCAGRELRGYRNQASRNQALLAAKCGAGAEPTKQIPFFIVRPVYRLRIPADPRLLFHFTDHAGEILISIDCSPGGIDLMRGCCRWHRHTHLVRFLENQSEVLIHEP